MRGVSNGFTGPRSACHSAESIMFMNIIAWGPQVSNGFACQYATGTRLHCHGVTLTDGNLHNLHDGCLTSWFRET